MRNILVQELGEIVPPRNSAGIGASNFKLCARQSNDEKLQVETSRA